ncbi:hypothetical protein D3C81_2266650 [compost metagenome]
MSQFSFNRDSYFVRETILHFIVGIAFNLFHEKKRARNQLEALIKAVDNRSRNAARSLDQA